MTHWLKWGLIGLVVGLIGVVWMATRVTIPTEEQQKPLAQILPVDWTLGNPGAQVVVIEYSDLQCPACRLYNGIGEELIKLFGDRVGFAYRHFPLKQIHPNATLAAQAAEVAGKQGKFWEMMQLLFEHQTEWAGSSQILSLFKTYAESVGVNPEQLQKQIDSSEIKTLVEADYQSAKQAKLDSTPTFLINGQKINNLRGTDDLIARVRLELEEATKSASLSAK